MAGERREPHNPTRDSMGEDKDAVRERFRRDIQGRQVRALLSPEEAQQSLNRAGALANLLARWEQENAEGTGGRPFTPTDFE